MPPAQEFRESRRNARGHGDLPAFRGPPRSARSPEPGGRGSTASRGTVATARARRDPSPSEQKSSGLAGGGFPRSCRPRGPLAARPSPLAAPEALPRGALWGRPGASPPAARHGRVESRAVPPSRRPWPSESAVLNGGKRGTPAIRGEPLPQHGGTAPRCPPRSAQVTPPAARPREEIRAKPCRLPSVPNAPVATAFLTVALSNNSEPLSPPPPASPARRRSRARTARPSCGGGGAGAAVPCRGGARGGAPSGERGAASCARGAFPPIA